MRVSLEPRAERAGTPSADGWPEWRCPEHQVALQELPGELECPRGHAFAVRDGIPRFVDGPTYADPFGLQWRRHRLTQLDSQTGVPLSRNRARRCLGERLWASLPGMQVLEAGCGAGRFTEVLLERGAHVTSVDLSDAVDANAENFPLGPRHRIAQADILKLPLMPGQHDIVFCLGVVQHTPDPEQAIARLYEHAKPGGALVFDHYTYRLGWFVSIKPLARLYFRRLPRGRGMRYSERIVKTLLPVHRRAGRLNKLFNRVSPVMSLYDIFPELPNEVQEDWALLDTHDALTAHYMRFRTPAGLVRTVRRLGLEQIESDPLPGGVVEIRGVRPTEHAE